MSEVKLSGVQSPGKLAQSLVNGIWWAVSSEHCAEHDAWVEQEEERQRNAAREKRYLDTGIEEKLRSVNLSDLTAIGLPEMKDINGNPVRDTAIFDGFLSDVAAGKPRVLLLLGDYGTGKSTLAAALMRELCRRGVSCAYYKSYEIMQRLEDVKWLLSRETRTGIMDGICCPRFRVIDEVGRYPDSKTEQFVLYDISNRCYETYGSSIYVTNLSRHEAGNFLGGAVIDRFRGIGMTIEFCGKSFRGTEKELYTR